MTWEQLTDLQKFDIGVIHAMMLGQTLFVGMWGVMPWWREWVGRSVMIKAVSLLVLIAAALAQFWLVMLYGPWEHWEKVLVGSHVLVVVGVWSQVVALMREKRIAKGADRAVGGTTTRDDVPASASRACNPVSEPHRGAIGEGEPVMGETPRHSRTATAGPIVAQSQSETLSPSLIRTLTPFLAGLLGTWLADVLGAPIDSAVTGAIVTSVIGYLYYAVARFLEVYASTKWGYILGLRKVPVYAEPPLPTTVVVRDEHGRTTVGTVGVVLLALGVVAALFALVGETGWFLPVILIVVGAALLAVDNGPRARL